MKIMAVVVAIAMISAMAVSGSANTVPRTMEQGPIIIGFFDNDQRLEVRVKDAVTSGGAWAFADTDYTLSNGMTRWGTPAANDNIDDVGGAGLRDAVKVIFAGFAGEEADIKAGDMIMSVAIEGIGDINIKGTWAWEVNGNAEVIVPIDVTVTNRPAPVETTTAATTVGEPPVDTPPADTTTGGTIVNPPTGVGFALIPALVAAGAAIVASRRRSK